MVGKGRQLSVFLALWLLLVCLLTACGSETPTATPQPSASSTSKLLPASKIDTLLSDLSLKYQTGGLAALEQLARERGLLDDSDQIHFSVTVTDASALPTVEAEITKLGGHVFEQYANQLGVAIKLSDFGAIEKQVGTSGFWTQLANLSQVVSIKVLQQPALDALPLAQTSAPNQGVGVIAADQWQKAGFSGQNVRVGIIDGGFSGYQKYLGSALPSQVTFKSFLYGGSPEGSEEHGVAVAEIIHSVAPSAQLFLAPIQDEIGFANAVDYLIANHVQIIQASLGWGGLWPGDGTGLMDQKLDQARQQGILPVISAGNYGQSHFMTTLKIDGNGYAQFEAGQNLLKITPETNSVWVALRWNESWSNPKTNLDLYILNSANQVVGSSRNVQGNGSPKPPSELVPFTATPGQTYYVQVKLVGDAPSAPLQFHIFAYDCLVDNSTAVQSLATPGDAAGALTVGATNWKDDALEAYSSEGPTQDQAKRLKPELMAPSEVGSVVYGASFGGTSASAPQVSGAAAVLWSADTNLKADQVARYLEANAKPLENGGLSQTTGYGRVSLGVPQSGQALEQSLPLPIGPAFRDDFANHASGLPNDSQAYYGTNATNASAYLMSPVTPGAIDWSVYNSRSFNEFRASFAVTPPSQDKAAFYGLLFWQQSADNYYTLLINGQRYALFHRNGTAWQTLINWSENAALQNVKTITLEATNSYIKIGVGGTILQTLNLSATGLVAVGGKIGFANGVFNIASAAKATNSKSVVTFSSLIIVPLSTR